MEFKKEAYLEKGVGYIFMLSVKDVFVDGILNDFDSDYYYIVQPSKPGIVSAITRKHVMLISRNYNPQPVAEQPKVEQPTV